MQARCILFLAFLLVGCAQTENTDYPVNNGYTLASAFKKLSKRNPETQRPAAIDDISVHKDQIYKKIGSRWLKADVYQQQTQEVLRPAIVLVHGGGWATGNRTMWAALAERLANLGYVAVTVSYRLSPEAKYPAAIHDIRDAVRWLRQNAERYGVDQNRIALAGGSAGGQLASLVGLTSGHKVLDKYAGGNTQLGDVSAVINIDGLSSFVVPLALKHENAAHKNPSAAGAWLGGRYQDVPLLWEQASPLNHVSKSTPPMLFIKSGRARFSAGIEQMEAKLLELEIPYKIEAFPDAPHSYWLFDPWVTPTAEKVDEFLNNIGLTSGG